MGSGLNQWLHETRRSGAATFKGFSASSVFSLEAVTLNFPPFTEYLK